MGGSRGKGQALAATLIAAALCAASPTAFAQDASDLEFTLSSDSIVLDDDDRERGRLLTPSAETQSRLFGLFNVSRVQAVADADVVAAGQSDRCEAAHFSAIDTDIFKTVGALGATPASNAAEAREDEADTALSGLFSYEWTHRSRDGACALNGEEPPHFDEDWRVVTALELSAQDFIDDANSDASGATLSVVFSPRIGRRVIGHKYQTRLLMGVYNNVGYSDFYDDWGFTNHDGRIGVEHLLMNGDSGALRLSVTGGRVFSNPEASSYSYGQLELRGEARNIGNDWSLISTGRVQFRDYDEAATPREDTIYSLSTVLQRRIANQTTLSIGITIRQRDSSDPDRDFTSVSLPIALRRTF